MTRRRTPSSDPPQGNNETARLREELTTFREEVRVQQVQLLESQKELELTRDRYEELFDFAPVAYLALDTGGVIREANMAAARLLGPERGSLVGRPLFLHVVDTDRRLVLDHVARCRRGETRVETEVTLKSVPAGVYNPAALVSTPVRQNLFLTAVLDLTERKRGEDERMRARELQARMQHDEQLARAASEAKDRFLAMLSHELRTPLTPILLALDSIDQHGKLPDGVKSTIEMIHRNVALETRLIDDLLDVSRIVQGKMTFVPETVDLHDIVRDVVEMMKGEIAQAEIDVSVSLAGNGHHVHVDPVRLRQVIWNLLHNALRNTPRQGKVRISTSSDRDRITLVVEDTGRGIDREMLPRIFNLFEQDEDLRRRGVGLGLGLPISKTIVEAHGGQINVYSEGRDRGARVCVELPVVPEPQATTRAPARVHHVAAAGRRILLVEDNEDSATALAELLELHGFSVQVAGSLRQALQHIEEADIIVSDIGLPDGSGHDLMRAVSLLRQIPAIALSGYGTEEDIHRSLEAGFARHLVKPVEPQRLLEALQRLDSES